MEIGELAMKHDETKELKERLERCQRLSIELLTNQQENEILSFGWAGNLGKWYMDVPTGNFFFNKAKIEALGYSMNEIPDDVHYSFFTNKIHPEDYSLTMNSMLHAFKDPENTYEIEYRIQHKDGSYRWFYDRGRITQWSEDNKPLFVVGIVFDINDKKQYEEELEYENIHLAQENTLDSLTQVYNRRYVLDELEYRLNRHLSIVSKLSIIMLDVDDFKFINDTFGHLVGDKVLHDVAQIINEAIRGFDLVGRYGGEEFLVVLPNTEMTEAKLVAQRIIEMITNHDFDIDKEVSISAGVASYEKNDNLTSITDRADRRLLQAKRTGKNKVVTK